MNHNDMKYMSFHPEEENWDSTLVRPYCPLPEEYLEDMETLSHEEFGRLIRILLWYNKTGQIPMPEGLEAAHLPRVINRQRRYYRDWDLLRRSRSERGKRGAQKRWNRFKGQETEGELAHETCPETSYKMSHEMMVEDHELDMEVFLDVMQDIMNSELMNGES